MSRFRRVFAGLSAAALLFGPLARAENCAEPQTQADMDICAGQDFSNADAALNATYKALAAKLTPTGRTSLRDAQRAWLLYRDRQCAFETAGSLGGSIHPMLEAQCQTELTKQQTARLKAQAACQEGDLSCGGQ